jgi:polyketide synthase PksN
MNSEKAILDTFRKVEKEQITPLEAFAAIEGLKQQPSPAPGNAVNILTRVFKYDEPYLREHVIFGEQVVLGVTNCSLAIEAVRAVPRIHRDNKPFPVHIRKFIFHQPIVVSPGEMVEVSVHLLEGESEGRWFFENRFKKFPGSTHGITTSGQFLPDTDFPLESVDIDRFLYRHDRVIPDEAFFKKRLLYCPPCFKVVEQAYVHGDEVLGEMRITSEVKNSTYQYHTHPALLNGGFIVAICNQSDNILLENDPEAMWIPFMVKDIYVREALPGHSYCYARVVRVDPGILAMDFCFCDANGQVTAALKDFVFRYTKPQQFLREKSQAQVETIAPAASGPQDTPGQNREETNSLYQYIDKYIMSKVADLLGDTGGKKLFKKNKNFMDLGIDSNTLILLAQQMEKELKIELYPTLFFEYQNIQELAGYFHDNHKQAFARYFSVRKVEEDSEETESRLGEPGLLEIVSGEAEASIEVHDGINPGDIAIIGMAGHFAGSPTPDAFWENLKAGKDLVREVPSDRWDCRSWFDPDRESPDKSYCKWGSFIEIDKFDPLFFGITPREAVWMDPQLRLLLEVTQETIEDAGYARKIQGTNTGVFVGVGLREYWDEILRIHIPFVDYQANSSLLFSLSGRISFMYDLHGPSFPVDTACSSSLTSLHLACRALRSGECDMAIASGTNLLISHLQYVYVSRMQALSPTGRCHTFDKAADGYVPGEGVAALLLKPLSRAVRDNDSIHAVIKGGAVNHVGKSNNPTAPRPELQTRVMWNAWEDARITPDTITYIEAHGTGTKLGDPIEINALKKAFERFTDKKGFCAVGTAKSHIGHLGASAGIAGIIKTVLSMKHKQIPTMPTFKELNPYIVLENSPFYINKTLEAWEAEAGIPRRAGVSSFGIGGSNAHIVIEEYIPTLQQSASAPPPAVTLITPMLFILSARDEQRLKAYARKMAEFLETKTPRPFLPDVVYTLQVGRQPMEERLAVVTTSIDNLKEKLDQYSQEKTGAAPGIDNLYQGNVKVNKAKNELLFQEEEGREFLQGLIRNKKCHQLAQLWVSGLEIDWPLMSDKSGYIPRLISLPTYPFSRERYWFPKTPDRSLANGRQQIPRLHPLIDTNESTLEEQCYKKVLTREDFYISDHVIGNTMVLPGVAYLEMARAAGNLARANGKVKREVRKVKRIIWTRPITLEEDMETQTVYIGLYPEADENMAVYEVSTTGKDGKRVVHGQGKLVYGNPNQSQAAIERIDIEAVKKRCFLRKSGTACYQLAREVGLNYRASFKPLQELYFNETGTEAISYLELPGECRETFWEFELHPSLLDGALQTVIGLTASSGRQAGTPYLPFTMGEVEILKPLSEKCWGCATLADKGEPGEHGEARDDLKKFNVELADEQGQVLVRIRDFTMRAFQPAASTAIPGSKMYFQGVWEEISPPPVPPASPGQEPGHILIFISGEPGIDSDWNTLNERGIRVTRVKPGNRYREVGGHTYEINPCEPDDYYRVLSALQQKNLSVTNIIHVWSNGSFREIEANQEALQVQLDRSIYSLFHLTRALQAQVPREKVQLLYVYQVPAGEVQPLYVAVNGFARTLRHENPRWIIKTVEMQTGGQPIINPGIELLLNQFHPTAEPDMEIRYEPGSKKQWVKRQRELALTGDKPVKTLPFREKGVYMITGGTGGLGLIFARYLAQQVKARLVLTDVSQPGPEKQKKLTQLENMGAEVLFIKADISRGPEVKKLVTEAKSRFKEIHGVIHAAGIIRDAYLVNKSKEQLEAVLAPKIWGTLWLDQATVEEPLDFFVLFSSIAAILGNPGQCDYAYANSFMDHFTLYRSSRHGPGKSLSINWSYWQEGGMRVSKENKILFVKIFRMKPIETEAGLEAFTRALQYHEGQVMFVQGDPVKMRKILANRINASPTAADIPAVPGPSAPGTGDDQLQQEIQKDLVKGVSTILNISQENIDLETEMGEFGFDSLTFTEYSNWINEKYDLEIMPSIFFEYPTILSFSQYLLDQHRDRMLSCYQDESKTIMSGLRGEPSGEPGDVPYLKTRPRNRFLPSTSLNSLEETGDAPGSRQLQHKVEPIAIIGMSGVMPGSDNLEIFWENLEAGKNLISEIPADRWDYRQWYYTSGKETNRTNVKWGGFMNRVDQFDALFFGISPREAEWMDPQQRILMETVWHTIEDAGYKASDLSGTRMGLFVGVGGMDYSELIKEHAKEFEPHLGTGVSHAVLVNRISYLLNVHGPSEPVDTACSSSLTAVHRAFESIRSKECDIAVAGGVNVIISPIWNVVFGKSGMLAPDGKCKTFDKKANGYVRAEGCGVVLLKPLSKARADNDHIYAVIKGTSINHGGRATSLTAPNPIAQAELIVRAWEKSGLDPTTVSYIETHGTGTELGDPIEINGLKKAFAELYHQWEKPTPIHPHCGLGSVKTNIGHLETAAGIAGLIKVVLAMKHQTLPRHLHFEELNPYIQLENTPFYIITETRPWKRLKDKENREIPRRAGISAFGFGGVNCHVVLEEYIQLEPVSQPLSDRQEPHLIIISAKNEKRLEAYAGNMVDFLAKNHGTLSLTDIAYTLQNGREEMEQRLAVVVRDKQELREKLQRFCQGETEIKEFYYSRAKPHTIKEKSAVGLKEEKSNREIENLVRQRQFNRLAQPWTSGEKINWQLLYPGRKPNRVSLPTYPFARESYWIRSGITPTDTSSPVSALKSLPTLVEPVSRQVKSFFETDQVQKERKLFLRFHYALAELEIFSQWLVLETFQEMGTLGKAGEQYDKQALREQLKIIPAYYCLYEELLDILNRAGFIRIQGDHITVTLASGQKKVLKELRRLEARKDRLLKTFPAIKPHVRFLLTCTNALPRILTGQADPLEVMFPGGSMELVEPIYRGNKISDFYNLLAARVIKVYIQHRIKKQPHSRIRILEVGAGTGATTTCVLEAINQYGKNICYLYTDISFNFIQQGKKVFAADYPYMNFKVLDIEKDPAGQSIEPHSLDIVLATNVYHATKAIRNTLTQTTRLLKPNGILVLNEAVQRQNFATLTFGLTSGWWLFQDREHRIKGSPLVSPGIWEKLMKASGFRQVRFFNLKSVINREPFQNIIIGEYTLSVPSALSGDEDKMARGIEQVEEIITRILAQVLEIDKSEFDLELPFQNYGVDSLLAVVIIDRLNEIFGHRLRKTDLFNYSTISTLGQHIVKDLGFRPDEPPEPHPGAPQHMNDDILMELLCQLEQGKLEVEHVANLLEVCSDDVS